MSHKKSQGAMFKKKFDGGDRNFNERTSAEIQLKMDDMPFLSELDRTTAEIVYDVIIGDLSDEEKEQFLRETLSSSAWKDYRLWSNSLMALDPSIFLDELSSGFRAMAEKYANERKFDQLEKLLQLKKISRESMSVFKEWKSQQITLTQMSEKSNHSHEPTMDTDRVFMSIGTLDEPHSILQNTATVTNLEEPEFARVQHRNKTTRRSSASKSDVQNLTMDHRSTVTSSSSSSLRQTRGKETNRLHMPSDDLINLEEEHYMPPQKERYSAHLDGKFSQSLRGQSERKSSYSTAGQSTLDHSPNQMNILVLGETGVGKSTFINGIVNYLKYGSLEEALAGGVECLIETAFTLTDDDVEEYEIVCPVTITDDHSGENILSNENGDVGQSATQSPKSYVFSYESGQSVRIIDTPGIGDTRGIDQDKLNFDKILAYISNFNELHAVCILIKPNTARLTLAFRFCIDELLVHLHKSASQNILFCFTNTRGTLYRPGDTLPVLKEHLNKLQSKRGIDIPLDRSRIFCFDNESFRFLCASKNNFQFTPSERKNFKGSWTHSVEETFRLFSSIAKLPVHMVQDTLSLNNTRNVILALTRPLGEIAKNQMLNIQMIQEKLHEVRTNARDNKIILNRLYVNQVVLNGYKMDKPRTVCTAGRCVEYKRVHDGSNQLQTVYKMICHEDCTLEGVQVERCPNPDLRGCLAFSDDGLCHECGCPWHTHMHIRYGIGQKVVQVMDPHVEDSLKRNDSDRETLHIFLDVERKKMEELRSEHDMITLYCAEFSAFLAEQSIIPYNDSYGQYLDHLVKEEQEKVNFGGGKQLLEELVQMRKQYMDEVLFLQKSVKDNGKRVKSVKEIDVMIAQLSRLRHCGPVIDEIKNLRLLSVQEKAQDHGQKIRIGGDDHPFTPSSVSSSSGRNMQKQKSNDFY